jgi:DNA repair photolyase
MPVEVREEPCRTALNRVTGMMFRWSLNPYMGCAHRCAFCYVRFFERRAERPSGERYGRSVRVKTNVAEVLAEELRRPSWKGERVAIGAATDPYQPIEARYRLTRRCLTVLTAACNPFDLITRGPMIARDADVLGEAARRMAITVNFSIPTLDRDIWRKTEPGTASPEERLRALRVLRAAGVRAGVGLAPILPGLTDRPESLAAVVRAAREADAAFVWANWLYLKPGTREHFLEAVARHWPELLPLYERLYGADAYLRAKPVHWLERRIRALRAEHGLPERREAPAEEIRQLTLALGHEPTRTRRTRRVLRLPQPHHAVRAL